MLARVSIRNPIQNNRRHYIAGLDPIEEADARLMQRLGLVPQYLSQSPALHMKAHESPLSATSLSAA